MSDITLRLAEACDRAAMWLRWLSNTEGQPKNSHKLDAKELVALAAALRGATEVSSLDGTRIVNVVLTLGDA